MEDSRKDDRGEKGRPDGSGPCSNGRTPSPVTITDAVNGSLPADPAEADSLLPAPAFIPGGSAECKGVLADGSRRAERPDGRPVRLPLRPGIA